MAVLFGRIHALVLAISFGMLVTGVAAGAEEAEPSREDCTKALQRGHELASRLSPKSLSRYFALRYLQSAEAEAGNGEFDECVEFATKAVDEIENRSHWLAPGETFRATTATGYIELSGDDQ